MIAVSNMVYIGIIKDYRENVLLKPSFSPAAFL